MATQIVYTDEFNKHDNNSHPENARRLMVMIEEIKKTSFHSELDFIKPELLPEKALFDIHTKGLIGQIIELSAIGEAWVDLDTYICKGDYETARLAAGGLVLTCNNVINGKADNAFALVRPPGHHATKARSMGFCLFNNAALAANDLTKQGKKVLIFDLDVHHGNGTQDIFYDRNDVMYQSIHLSPHYPGTGSINETGTGKGEGFTINAPLHYGHGNHAVSKILEEIFLPITKQFKPDIIIISSGFDSHHADPLGGLKFTANFYGEMISKFQKLQPKIVCTLEGGYNLNWIGKCLISQLGVMSGNPIKIEDSSSEDENIEELLKKVKDETGKYWKI